MAAKRSSKSSGRDRRPAKPKAASRKGSRAVDATEKPSVPMETVLVVFSAILLIAALLLIDFERGRYGTGVFFTGNYSGQQ